MDSFQGISFCWGREMRQNRVAVPRGQGGSAGGPFSFRKREPWKPRIPWVNSQHFPVFLNGHEVVVRFHHFPTYPFCIFFRWVLFNRNCWDTTISVQRSKDIHGNRGSFENILSGISKQHGHDWLVCRFLWIQAKFIKFHQVFLNSSLSKWYPHYLW